MHRVGNKELYHSFLNAVLDPENELRQEIDSCQRLSILALAAHNLVDLSYFRDVEGGRRTGEKLVTCFFLFSQLLTRGNRIVYRPLHCRTNSWMTERKLFYEQNSD